MLEDIVTKLVGCARTGLHIRDLKLGSHIKIQRKKKADKSATAATNVSKCSQRNTVSHTVHTGLQDLYWPVQAVEKMNNEGNNVAEGWLAGDLTSALKKVLCSYVMPKKQCKYRPTPTYRGMWIYNTK